MPLCEITDIEVWSKHNKDQVEKLLEKCRNDLKKEREREKKKYIVVIKNNYAAL